MSKEEDDAKTDEMLKRIERMASLESNAPARREEPLIRAVRPNRSGQARTRISQGALLVKPPRILGEEKTEQRHEETHPPR